MPRCLVVQGSKLSTTLYRIYINEQTELNKLMDDQIFLEKTRHIGLDNSLIKKIDHMIAQYVNDNTNIISTNE